MIVECKCLLTRVEVTWATSVGSLSEFAVSRCREIAHSVTTPGWCLDGIAEIISPINNVRGILGIDLHWACGSGVCLGILTTPGMPNRLIQADIYRDLVVGNDLDQLGGEDCGMIHVSRQGQWTLEARDVWDIIRDDVVKLRGASRHAAAFAAAATQCVREAGETSPRTDLLNVGKEASEEW